MTNTRILEARQLFQKVLDGNLRARAELSETMSTSDFPILLGAAYGREMLQEYQSINPVWQQFARRVTVPNFKAQTLVEILGGRAGLEKVKQGAEYKARALTEGKYEFKVEKFGARIPLTWEMLINDELDAFRDLPERLATAARETEERNALSPLFNAGGTALNTTFFAGNAAPVTAKLSADALEAAILSISTRKDSDGRPIILAGAILMVAPALEMTARRILNATEIKRTDGNVTTTESNYLQGAFTLVVNPWLNVVGTGNANINTTWFVLPAPAVGRPALVNGFLRGHETPSLRAKADTGTSIGGGTIGAEDGSFDDDSIQYRVRHVNGAAALVNSSVYASTGTAA